MPSVSTSTISPVLCVEIVEYETETTETTAPKRNHFVVGSNHIDPYNRNTKPKVRTRTLSTQTLKDKSPPKVRTRTLSTQTLKDKPPKAAPKEKEECPVCLKTLGAKNIVITKCGHKFCTKCIFTNFGKSQNGHHCPMCRTNFAPAFLTASKYTLSQVAASADSVLDSFWREDYRLNRPANRERRLIESATGYSQYIDEYGYENVPYLELVDHMWDMVKHRGDKVERFNKLHGFIDNFIVSGLSQRLAQKLDILH